MSVLVFLQHIDGALPKTSLVTIAAARQIAEAFGLGSVTSLCLGTKAKDAATSAAEYGITEALYNESSEFDSYIAPLFTRALCAGCQVSSAVIIVGAATSTGKDLFPRVAGALDAGMASDIIAVNSDKTFKRPMYAGDLIADVEITTALKVVSVRVSAFTPAEKTSVIGTVRECPLNVGNDSLGKVVKYETAKAERPELGDASIVVSGGRALGSAENFEKVLFPLADALGAAVGASRAAVDSGYAPNDWQVGQTGKIVAPNLYIAVGVSGAIQHLAGMKDSKTIVAINKDPEAPIFEVATYGLVAGLFEVVPKIVEALQKR